MQKVETQPRQFLQPARGDWHVYYLPWRGYDEYPPARLVATKLSRFAAELQAIALCDRSEAAGVAVDYSETEGPGGCSIMVFEIAR